MTALTIIPPALLGRTAFDQIFDSFFQDPFPMIKRSTEGYPLTDIYVDSEGNQVIEIALAGFSKEELAVEVMDNKVTIRAAAHLPEDDSKNQGLQRRIAQRAFSRTFVDYNNQLDLALSSVSFENGLLRIVIPKIPEQQPIVLSITD
tara:strand:+ start:257 stop:697 length:441 start_codon:yes stop_codon:yes gene_type:complete